MALWCGWRWPRRRRHRPTRREMIQPLFCIFPARCNLTSAACEQLLSKCGPEQSRPSNDEAWHAYSCGGQNLLVVGGNDRDCLCKGRCRKVLVRRDALVLDLDLVSVCDDVLHRSQSHRDHAEEGTQTRAHKHAISGQPERLVTYQHLVFSVVLEFLVLCVCALRRLTSVLLVGVAGAAAVVEHGDDWRTTRKSRAEVRCLSRLRAKERRDGGGGGASLHDLTAASFHRHYGREGRSGAHEGSGAHDCKNDRATEHSLFVASRERKPDTKLSQIFLL